MGRNVDADTRTALGRPISFQEPYPEFPHPNVEGRFLEFFRPRKNVAQLMEIVSMRLARITRQKGIGPEQYGAIEVVKGRRDHPEMERRNVEKNKRPSQ